jgi:NTE family protein
MKTVVVFQGGGALGAFSVGAWQKLALSPEILGGPVIAVAGASIGAVNAAAVAYNFEADAGALALEALWRDRMSTPSFPFFGLLPTPVPPTPADAENWNGFMTGVLFGNPNLYTARWPHWQPLSALARLQQPLHDRSAMLRLLEEHFPLYASAAGDGPMLAAAAVDVLSGDLRLFDSDSAPLTARHLAASSAIPLLFDPIIIDDRLYWDGEITRDSMLPVLLARLLEVGRLERNESLQLVTIESMPRALVAPPESGAEIVYRALNLLQVGKLDPPEVDGVRIARVRRVVREPQPEDGVSGQFDYSPRRIDELIEAGREAAQRTLRAAMPVRVAA